MTAPVVLRNLREELHPEDRDRILGWRNLPDVARYMYTDRAITAEEHERWFARILEDDTVTYWVVELDGEPVGLANLTGVDRDNRRCSWAFYLASPAVRGRGVGTFVEYFVLQYVFETLGLEKLCCEVLSFNDGVVAMHEGYGFQREGLLRRHIYKDGISHDVVVLGMLKEDWEASKPVLAKRLASKGLTAP